MKRPIRVLLVEDDPGDVRLTEEALSHEGTSFRLTVANDGIEALEMLRDPTFVPDLILLDLRLPRGSGFEVLAAIKEDPRLRAVPVVVLTGSHDEEDVRLAYELQANCYVTKPLDAGQLRPVIQLIEHFWTTIVRLPREEP